MVARWAWMFGLWACSVFPERAILPDDDASGGMGTAGGGRGGEGLLSAGVGGRGASGGTSGAGPAGRGGVEAGGASSAGRGNEGGASGATGGGEGAAGAGAGEANAGAGGAGEPLCEGAEVAIEVADQDAWISELEATQSHPDGTTLELGSIPGDRAHALLGFTLSAVPPSRKLVGARLTVELRTSPGETRSLALYRVTRGWRDRQATWLQGRNGADGSWIDSGGDVAPEPSDRAELLRGASVGTRLTFDVTADVLNMLASPLTNFGWSLRYEEEGAARVALAASEFAMGSPELTFTHCP